MMDQKMNRVDSVVHTLPSTQARTQSGLRRTQTATWNEEMTTGWRFTDASESTGRRVARYISYLNPSENQLFSMSERIQEYVEERFNKSDHDLIHHVSSIKFAESGEAYSVDLGSKTIVAVKITKNGEDVNVEEVSTPLTEKSRDLTAPTTTAYDLFDAIAETICKLPQPSSVGASGFVPIAFVCSFDVTLRSSTSMYLNKWSKGMQTGRDTEDPVEDSDMAAMLETALRRKGKPFRVTCAMTDLTAAGVLGMTQLCSDEDNSVRFMMNLGTGFGIGAIVSSAKHAKSRGDIFDSGVNMYDGKIPRADFDLEVDWADGNIDENRCEKLVAAKYLGEIARRVILKIFQERAPKLLWSRTSLPPEAAARMATDSSEDGAVTKEIMKILYQWDISTEDSDHIKRICTSVFNRSASLVAASLCAVARAQNGLIPALGGSIVAVSGFLYNSNAFYRSLVREKIDTILGPILSRLLILSPVKGGSAVGAALMVLKE